MSCQIGIHIPFFIIQLLNYIVENPVDNVYSPNPFSVSKNVKNLHPHFITFSLFARKCKMSSALFVIVKIRLPESVNRLLTTKPDIELVGQNEVIKLSISK